MKKLSIKTAMLKADIPQWKIARHLGIGETTLCRWLRDDEIEDGRANDILTAISEIEFSRQRGK